MATYKVPQDVEAEDKLLGPFTFRQFIYLIIVALSIALAWGLGQVFILLSVIPLPIILLFGALALPLRKDQPMEIYLAAMVSFYLKPRKRLWDPDGVESLIEITAPKVVEVQRTKDISQSEADRRFGYLAEIVDSEGWAVRGPGMQAPNSSMATDVYYAAQTADDVLDDNNTVSRSFDYMIDQADARHREEAMAKMRETAAAAATMATAAPAPASPVPPPSAVVDPTKADDPSSAATIPTPTPVASDDNTVGPAVYNPYPTDIQQHVIEPLHNQEDILGDRPVPKPEPKPAPTTSEKPVSADIMNLANNTDLSVETIAREAHRLSEKQGDDMQEEVVISLH